MTSAERSSTADAPPLRPVSARAPDQLDPVEQRQRKAVVAELFDIHARALHSYLAGRVGQYAADDLVAETFLIAFRRWDTYDPAKAPVRGWLYGIATNVLRNHRRQEIRRFQATASAMTREGRDLGEPHDSRVAARVDAEHRMRQLAGALVSELGEDERDVLLLTSWAHLEPTEVAAALGIPASTVRTRLQRVRQKLRTRELSNTITTSTEDDNA
jgi:RNA polymerase sigma factor (sigma-70 family)